VYRGIEDLAKRANLAARDWPDTVTTSIVFDKDTVGAAIGNNNPSSDTGRQTLSFANGGVATTVTAFDNNGNQDVSFVSGGGSEDSIGGCTTGACAGGNGLIGSGTGEGLRIDFGGDARQFAFTLDSFDDIVGAIHEQVELRFYEFNGVTATQQGPTIVKQSCSSNGKVASFTVDPGASFNRVEMRAVNTNVVLGISFPSAFSLAEIDTCAAAVTCQTSLQPSGNTCP
jgi:hypothetical protein